MVWQPDLVLYHGNCNDGFGAAFVAFQRFGEQDIEFVPVAYGSEPVGMHGRNVLMVDVTYTASQLGRCAEVVGSMIILDHHKTARDALALYQMSKDSEPLTCETASEALAANVIKIIAHFDMEKSGARLAWEFCFPGKEPPALIRYIEDHDLWRHQLQHSMAVSVAVDSYPHDFATWKMLSEKGQYQLGMEGDHILRDRRKMIASMLAYKVWVKIGGYSVPVLNLPPMLASLGGHMLLESHTEAHFAATWFNRGERDQWSLRSQDNRMDVGAMAKIYGGGGHRNAAGFHVEAGAAITGIVKDTALPV